MGWWLGCPVQRSNRNSSRHNRVGVTLSRAQPRVPVQVFGVAVIRTGNPPKQAVGSAPISGREGER
jgi:hypothetical protein